MVDVLTTEAAQDVSKELEFDDNTHCMICREYMFEPRTFDCGHSFCLGCQIQVFRTAEKDRSDKACPKCRRIVKRVVINFGLRDLLSALNPGAYEQSGKFYDESQDERMFSEVSECLSESELKRLLEKNEKKFRRCCKLVFRYSYWVSEKGNKSKFDQFFDRDFKENSDKLQFLISSSIPRNFNSSYVETFFTVKYKTLTYIFF